MMARRPTDFIQFKLRMRESLRRKIEAAADKKMISANAEAVELLETALENQALIRELRQRLDEALAVGERIKGVEQKLDGLLAKGTVLVPGSGVAG